jgi:chromosomal replication initiator protein
MSVPLPSTSSLQLLEVAAQEVSRKVTQEFGETIYKSWIKPLTISGFEKGCLGLIAPSLFVKDWVLANYSHKLLQYWIAVLPEIERIEIEVRIKSANENSDGEEAEKSAFLMDEIFDESREDLGAALDSRFTFENFVVAKPNEFAHAAALRVAESETPLFNPLFLYGGVGLGKTHLMHAIAWQIKKVHPERKVIYLSAEKFMYQFIRALRYKDTVSFKEQFRNVDVLMIDDIQFIGGKETTQEEFFHTFNALVDNNKQVIMSADKSPSDLERMEERLKSRLAWGLVADIHPTTYELRLGVLQAKAETMKVKVPKEVMEFLAFKISSNIRELEGALNRIVAHVTLVGRNITLDNTQEVLRDLLRSNDRRLSIEDIQKRVCEFYSIKMSDLLSSRRVQNIVRARQVAMYLSKILTSKSLPEIGRKFGGKDHTTVLHAVRKVEEICAKDKEFNSDTDILRRSLEN